MPDILSAALRALGFCCVLQAAGVALFLALFGRLLAGSREPVRRLGRASALLGLAVVAGQFSLEAARMAGEFSGLWDLSLQRAALRSTSGAALGLKVAALALLSMGLTRRGELAFTVSLVGATLAIAAFLLMGHTSVHPERWLLAPLLAVHLLVVAFWLGALLPLILASVRESPDVAAKLVSAFSVIATALVPVIFVAGLGMALLLVPSWAVLWQPYGALLIVKIAGFAALMGLASLNKWRLGPAIASGEERALKALRWSVAGEYVLILAVLTATAIMTMFFSPE
jgi:putative copper resistance protein D